MLFPWQASIRSADETDGGAIMPRTNTLGLTIATPLVSFQCAICTRVNISENRNRTAKLTCASRAPGLRGSRAPRR